MLVSAPGDLSMTGVYYGLLDSASMVSDNGKSRYLLNVLAAGQEMTLLTEASSGRDLFAPQGGDEDYLMAGRSYVRFRIGQDGAVDQLVKLSQSGQDTPRWVRGVVTALPGDGKGISLSQGYTVQDGTVVPGEDFYSDITVYPMHEQAAVYTVDAFPQDRGGRAAGAGRCGRRLDCLGGEHRRFGCRRRQLLCGRPAAQHD